MSMEKNLVELGNQVREENFLLALDYYHQAAAAGVVEAMVIKRG